MRVAEREIEIKQYPLKRIPVVVTIEITTRLYLEDSEEEQKKLIHQTELRKILEVEDASDFLGGGSAFHLHGEGVEPSSTQIPCALTVQSTRKARSRTDKWT